MHADPLFFNYSHGVVQKMHVYSHNHVHGQNSADRSIPFAPLVNAFHVSCIREIYSYIRL